ncbi:MAG: hypothetical protein KJ957_01930 [Candidatus Omnitrophica bacterium]|nr:hypothetical protein [Candidatus Omnitrophota bacterium]MBU1852788.1 hypothetical protein [Candidatus Omnitrophota bacterium]
MFCRAKNLSILVSLLTLTTPLYAEGSLNIDYKIKWDCLTFSDWINTRNYTYYINKKEEKEKLREEWKNMLGLDIFYPYFKANEIKSRTEEKISVKIFNIKGKLELRKDQAFFTFRMKF